MFIWAPPGPPAPRALEADDGWVVAPILSVSAEKLEASLPSGGEVWTGVLTGLAVAATVAASGTPH